MYAKNPIKTAAMIKLVNEVLSSKKQGDRITRKECQAVLTEDGLTFDEMRPRIRKYFLRKCGWELVAVRGDGYRIALPGEQVTDVQDRFHQGAMRKIHRSLQAVTAISNNDLTPAEQVYREKIQAARASAWMQMREQKRMTNKFRPKLMADPGRPKKGQD